MKPITLDELMNLSRKEFIDRNLEFLNGEQPPCMEVTDTEGKKSIDPLRCPLHVWVVHNHTKCPNEMVSLTSQCPLCGYAMCPDCNNHFVEQLSRVTGYMSGVSGWNAAKQQEFKDRNRYQV